MNGDSETLVSSGGTYTVTCPADLVDVVLPYINAVDEAFGTLKECYGRDPKIKTYDVAVLKEPTKNAKGQTVGTAYLGSDESCIGRIQLVIADEKTKNRIASPSPCCLRGAVVFETIHGFLQPARLPRDSERKLIGKNRLGETFSLIIQISFLERIGDVEGASHFRYGGKWGPRFLPFLFSLIEIYDQWGITPFQRLFHHLEDRAAQRDLLLDEREYGLDSCTPFTPNYMRRLAELLRETSRIDVFEILDSRAFRMAASLAFAARPPKRRPAG